MISVVKLLSLAVFALVFDIAKCDDFVEKQVLEPKSDLRSRLLSGNSDGSSDESSDKSSYGSNDGSSDGYNETEHLLQKCSNAGIVCDDVAAEDLATCTNMTKCDDDLFHRNLAFTFENYQERELYSFLQGIQLDVGTTEEKEAQAQVDLEMMQLRGSDRRLGKGKKNKKNKNKKNKGLDDSNSDGSNGFDDSDSDSEKSDSDGSDVYNDSDSDGSEGFDDFDSDGYDDSDSDGLKSVDSVKSVDDSDSSDHCSGLNQTKVLVCKCCAMKK
mmetsp:Transcript_15909/g.32592  ORF Transcript_15909/g.32592 Transcript_15909/m.32592 type:complete len:271 (-) Transcript_15909:166-978(-)